MKWASSRRAPRTAAGGRRRPTSKRSRPRATPIRSPSWGRTLRRAGWAIRAFAPDAIGVKAVTRNGAPLAEFVRRSGDFFEALAPNQSERPAYRLELTRADGVETCDDPYAFGPVLGPLDDHLLVEGAHRQLYKRLGAQLIRHEGVDGVLSPSGRPTPRASRWSATSTAGTAAATDAQAPRQRPVGDLRPGPRRRRGLQIRDSRRGRRPFAAQGRPVRLRGRDAALDRLGRRRHRRISSGATPTISNAAGRANRGASRWRSTRSISVRGGAAPTTAS